MSVQELNFKTRYEDMLVHDDTNDGSVIISLGNQHHGMAASLDRNQMHLLMLYLQERLGRPDPMVLKPEYERWTP